MTIGFADFVGFLAREMTKGVTAGTALRRAVIHFLPRGPADRPDQGLAVLLSLIQAEMLKGKSPCQALRVAVETLNDQMLRAMERQSREEKSPRRPRLDRAADRARARGRDEERRLRDYDGSQLAFPEDEEIPF